jgi:hypothetical protein
MFVLWLYGSFSCFSQSAAIQDLFLKFIYFCLVLLLFIMITDEMTIYFSSSCDYLFFAGYLPLKLQMPLIMQYGISDEFLKLSDQNKTHRTSSRGKDRIDMATWTCKY